MFFARRTFVWKKAYEYDMMIINSIYARKAEVRE